jgi:hypothetical protein
MSIFENLLGNLNYMGEKYVNVMGLALGVHMDVVNVYKNMHAGLTFHSILILGSRFKLKFKSLCFKVLCRSFRD